MLLILATLAFGADPQDFPVRAQIDLSACTTCTTEGDGTAVYVALPPEARSPGDSGDAIIVDAAGKLVSTVWLTFPKTVESTPVSAHMDPQNRAFDIAAADRPIDGLTITLKSDTATKVQVEREVNGSWVAHGDAQWLWKDRSEEQSRVRFPAVREPLRVRSVDGTALFEATDSSRIRGTVSSDHSLPASEIDLELVSTKPALHGGTAYTFALPHPVPPASIAFQISDTLFERSVSIGTDTSPTSYAATLRRSTFGGAQIERTTVPWSSPLVSETLVAEVSNGDGKPLDITGATLQLTPRAVIFRDTGAGPYTLYAAGPPGSGSTSSELSIAEPELRRDAVGPFPLVGMGANPDWVPPEVRTGLGAPGAELPLRWSPPWEREISGPSGLVRFQIPLDVAARSREDLGDLRILTAEGRRQIPYLLSRNERPKRFEQVPFERTERGKETLITFELPEANLYVTSVILRAGTDTFSRRTTLMEPSGLDRYPLATADWDSSSHASGLSFSVQQRVGDKLVIRIENGDNPPLPVESIDFETQTWAVTAVLPDNGARLTYGIPSLSRPDYDLELLEPSIRGRVLPDATLGEQRTSPRPVLAWTDSLLLLSGLGVLGGGLFAVIVSMFFGPPKEPEEIAEDADPAKTTSVDELEADAPTAESPRDTDAEEGST